jgi:hypothetical protein
MTTKITDYISVRQRASELGCTVPTRIAILPTNFDFVAARTDFQQLSEAATVKALFRTNNVPLDDLLPASERAPYIQNNSFEWLAPTLFISSSLLIDNQAAVSVALSVLSNYITDFFKGVPGQKTVKLDIVVERNGDMSCKKISYEGDVNGIDSLVDVIRQISNE